MPYLLPLYLGIVLGRGTVTIPATSRFYFNFVWPCKPLFLRVARADYSAANTFDLNPAGYTSSDTGRGGIMGTQLLGYGAPAGTSNFSAVLWGGTAASVIDLNPSGFISSFGYAIGGTQEVGHGSFSKVPATNTHYCGPEVPLVSSI